MSSGGVATRGGSLPPEIRQMGARWARHAGYGVLGIGILVGLWWLGITLLTANPDLRAFAGFGPGPTFEKWPQLWANGRIQSAISASLVDRLGTGLLIAALIGIPVGILVGRSRRVREFTHAPFQFIRMVSPLAWMPLAVLLFASWDASIVFIIAIAAVWPVMYSTAAGLEKVDVNWVKVARNLGANRFQVLKSVILPATAFDILSGLRLALGVAWIVLIPAELLGVTSGLGYAIRDARETVDYSYVTSMILTIGVIGFIMDTILVGLINRYSWYHRRQQH